MLPASAVSGFYLSHPQAKLFRVGKIAATSSRITAPQRHAGARGGEVAGADLAYEPQPARLGAPL